MTIVYDKLMALEIEPVVQVYEAKDCMLYALGVGLGHDPTNEDELAFVYEKNLKVLPTMATVIGHSTTLARNPNTGIDWLMVVNGEQGFTLRRPLKGQDAVIGRTRIVEVIDKGPGRGALLVARAEHHRQSDRRPDRGRDADDLLPRRRRLRRAAARGAAAACHSGARARRGLRSWARARKWR